MPQPNKLQSTDTQFYSLATEWHTELEQLEKAVSSLKECGGSHLYKVESLQAILEVLQVGSRLRGIHHRRTN